MKKETLKGLLALSPLLVFLLVYLLSSVLAHDFYAVPVCSAFLIACIYAVAISDGPLSKRIRSFSNGAAHPNVLQMIWIFILAGAFAGTAKDMGAVDATVNATLSIIPSGMICAGLFLTACFISMAIGTSVGTIVALVPLGAGLAASSGVSEAYMAAVIVGGAFFGDNLSFISDTTIASTRAACCEMRDKFGANLKIVIPAMLIVTAIYLVQGHGAADVPVGSGIDWIKILPYLLIIILALLRCDVNVLLVVGIAVIAMIGWCTGSFTWTAWLASLGRGISGMSDLIIVTMLAGGLLELIRTGGGLELIIQCLTRKINGRRGAKASIAALVCLANVCTANNTIAIITVGGIAKDISDRYGISPKITASLLDTFSCFVQGLLPYGAQVLMAAGLAAVAPTEIIPHLYYPLMLGLCATVAIVLDVPKKQKNHA